MDNEHVLALIEAVDGAHLDAVHKLTANTTIVDDVGHLAFFPQIAEVSSFTICTIAVFVHWLKMDAQKTYVLWLNRNTEEQAFSGQGARARQVAAHHSAEVRAVLATTDLPTRITRS